MKNKMKPLGLGNTRISADYVQKSPYMIIVPSQPSPHAPKHIIESIKQWSCQLN